jgi:hypothetical protein
LGNNNIKLKSRYKTTYNSNITEIIMERNTQIFLSVDVIAGDLK